MHTTTLQRAGGLALAVTLTLTGCQATQTRAESADSGTVGDARAPAPEALAGHWKGSWDAGGGDIAITIGESGDTPVVTYCFRERCWHPADVALDGAALTFTAQGNLRYRFELDGDQLRATLKKGGRTFRARMDRFASETAAAAESSQTTSTPAAAPEPTGLAMLAGQWSGRWSGGAKSTLTVTGDTPDTMAVQYCYRDECWDIEEYTFDEGTLAWRSPSGWVFEFDLEGKKVRGKLTNPRGTSRISMKRM